MLFSNITETLPLNARRRPDHPAVIQGDRTLTYGELALLVARTGFHLASQGVREGELVGIALKDNIEHIVAMLAVARIGAAILPIDWRWSQQEKQRLVDFFVPRLVLIESDATPLSAVACAFVDDAWNAAVNKADANDAPRSLDPDAPLLLSLSSGTTGRPKGPMLTHRLLQNRFVQHWAVLGFHEQDRHLVSTPLYFGGGRVFALSHIFVGATTILLPLPYQLADLIEAVSRYRISTTFIVPTLLRRLMELPWTGAPLLEGPRYVISGGSALRPAERLAALSTISSKLINYYSSSEGGAVSILLPEHSGEAAESVGRPVFMTRVEVVDDNDRLVATGVSGHIRYCGPGVPSALYRDDDQSASMFRDGWFYPGDLGMIDAQGFLHLVGRAKDMIIRGGINIYPQDIERVLAAAPGVHDAAVVGWPSQEYGEELAAFVVRAGDVAESALLTRCKAELAPYKVPRAIFFVDALPKNATGKVIKSALVEKLPPLRARRDSASDIRHK
jgi:acyl-CoA synthetase (AMP-forming)/AMP-acid ligase II